MNEEQMSEGGEDLLNNPQKNNVRKVKVSVSVPLHLKLNLENRKIDTSGDLTPWQHPQVNNKGTETSFCNISIRSD